MQPPGYRVKRNSVRSPELNSLAIMYPATSTGFEIRVFIFCVSLFVCGLTDARSLQMDTDAGSLLSAWALGESEQIPSSAKHAKEKEVMLFLGQLVCTGPNILHFDRESQSWIC